MYKLGIVGIYEIGFLKDDFDHGPGFNTLSSFVAQFILSEAKDTLVQYQFYSTS